MKKHQPRTIAKLEPVQQAALDAALQALAAAIPDEKAAAASPPSKMAIASSSAARAPRPSL